MSNNFTVSSTLNYSTSTFKAPLQSAIYDALFNTPRSINLAGWPNAHPITGEEISFQNSVSNPYWMLNNSGYLEGVNRSYGNIRAVYTFNDKLSATYSYGLDNSVVQRRSHINRGDVFGGLGQLSTENTRTTVTNHTLMLNYNNRFSEEKFGITLDGGADVFQRKSNYAFASSTNQIQTSVLEHQFFEEHSAGSSRVTLNRPGLFTQLIADYKNFIYLNASGRVDWTSNFIENSIFYPSVGISFIPTSAFSGLRSDNFNYLKIRAGYATSADFDVPGGSAYPVYQGVNVNTRPFISENEGLIATNSISGFLGNTALEPALLEEYEIGLETKLWKNRISLDAAYFNRITNNLIFSRILDPATGYETTPINVNEFKAWGVELDLSVDVIKNQNITWNVGGNFTSIRTEVTEIDEQFAIASFGTVQNSMIQGQPLRVLTGTVIATDEDGNFLTNGRQYLIGDDPEIIGDPNPDFVTSFFTTFRYKNFSLSANVQWTQGGDIYSATARSLLARGLTTDTDGLNNVGYVLPGINANTGEPNTVIISSGDAYFNEYANGPDVFGIFDATSIRLQELSLRYAFSPKQLERSPFGNLSIAIVGENLYFKAINMPSGVRVDTNTIGLDNPNALGIESQIGPAGRRVGLSIKASF